MNNEEDQQIQQLKEAIHRLRPREKEYLLLQQQLRQLQHKYESLQKQKQRKDKEHMHRREHSSQVLTEYRREIALFREQISLNRIELDKIKQETEMLEKSKKQHDIQIKELRNKKQEYIVKDRQLKQQSQETENYLRLEKQKNQQLTRLKNQAEQDYQKYLERCKQLEIKLEEHSRDTQQITQDISIAENQLAVQQRDLEAKKGKLKSLEKQMLDAETAIKELQIDIREVSAQNDKMKSDADGIRRLTQIQISRSKQLQRTLQTIDNAVKSLTKEKDQVNKHLADLVIQNQEIMEVNEKLESDTQNTDRYIDVLMVQNQELLEELDRMAEEDEMVKHTLNRKKYRDRWTGAQEMYGNYGNHGNQTVKSMNDILTSSKASQNEP